MGFCLAVFQKSAVWGNLVECGRGEVGGKGEREVGGCMWMMVGAMFV